jgi:hypothetical protein
MVSGHLARDAGSLDPRPSLPQTVWVAYADLYGLIQPRPSVWQSTQQGRNTLIHIPFPFYGVAQNHQRDSKLRHPKGNSLTVQVVRFEN